MDGNGIRKIQKGGKRNIVRYKVERVFEPAKE